MQRNIKKQTLQLLDTMQYIIANELEKEPQLKQDCAEGSDTIGYIIENEAAADDTLKAASRSLSDMLGGPGEASVNELLGLVKTIYRGVSALPTQIKVAFMPYKIQMWGVLASVYETASKDPDCIAQVIPVPYHTCLRQPDGSVKTDKFVYEGDQFPKEIPIIGYSSYDLEAEAPDIVFLHNIYDDYNTLTRVDPKFHTDNLRGHTDMLVYVPYFVSPFFVPAPGDPEFWFRLPSLKNVDKIVLAGTFLKKPLMQQGIPENALLALGSPKLDLVSRTLKSPPEYPSEWKQRLGGRKVFFLNTLYHFGAYLDKLERILNIPRQFENTAVIWRPHPLTDAFISQNYPHLEQTYSKLKSDIANGRAPYENVVLDESRDYMQALSRADVMITGSSSLLNSFLLTRKPVIYLDEKMPPNSMISDKTFDFYTNSDEEWNKMITRILSGGDGRQHYRETASRIYANTDGNCGEKVYQAIKKEILGKDMR